jgi:hypothetical protein
MRRTAQRRQSSMTAGRYRGRRSKASTLRSFARSGRGSPGKRPMSTPWSCFAIARWSMRVISPEVGPAAGPGDVQGRHGSRRAFGHEMPDLVVGIPVGRGWFEDLDATVTHYFRNTPISAREQARVTLRRLQRHLSMMPTGSTRWVSATWLARSITAIRWAAAGPGRGSAMWRRSAPCAVARSVGRPASRSPPAWIEQSTVDWTAGRGFGGRRLIIIPSEDIAIVVMAGPDDRLPRISSGSICSTASCCRRLSNTSAR